MHSSEDPFAGPLAMAMGNPQIGDRGGDAWFDNRLQQAAGPLGAGGFEISQKVGGGFEIGYGNVNAASAAAEDLEYQRREREKDEYLRSLDAQVENGRRRRQEEKRRALDEERRFELKLQRDREEMARQDEEERLKKQEKFEQALRVNEDLVERRKREADERKN